MLDSVWEDFQELFVDGFSMVPVASVILGYSYLLYYRPEEFLKIAFFDRVIHSLAIGTLPLMALFGIFRFLYLSLDQITLSLIQLLKSALNEKTIRSQAYVYITSQCEVWSSREKVISLLEDSDIQVNTEKAAASLLIISTFLMSFIMILGHYDLLDHVILILDAIK